MTKGKSNYRKKSYRNYKRSMKKKYFSKKKRYSK